MGLMDKSKGISHTYKNVPSRHAQGMNLLLEKIEVMYDPGYEPSSSFKKKVSSS